MLGALLVRVTWALLLEQTALIASSPPRGSARGSAPQPTKWRAGPPNGLKQTLTSCGSGGSTCWTRVPARWGSLRAPCLLWGGHLLAASPRQRQLPGVSCPVGSEPTLMSSSHSNYSNLPRRAQGFDMGALRHSACPGSPCSHQDTLPFSSHLVANSGDRPCVPGGWRKGIIRPHSVRQSDVQSPRGVLPRGLVLKSGCTRSLCGQLGPRPLVQPCIREGSERRGGGTKCRVRSSISKRARLSSLRLAAGVWRWAAEVAPALPAPGCRGTCALV